MLSLFTMCTFGYGMNMCPSFAFKSDLNWSLSSFRFRREENKTLEVGYLCAVSCNKS